jgi:response regulator of citrate/malate metabolism
VREKVLLVTESDSYWHKRLNALEIPMTDLTQTSHLAVEDAIKMYKIKIFIIDASYVNSTIQLIEVLHNRIYFPRIIVVGNKKNDWKEAREMFRSGIVDYLTDNLSDYEISRIIRQAISKPLIAT